MSGWGLKLLQFGGWIAILMGCASPTSVGAGDTNFVVENFLVSSWHTESGLPDGNITALAETADGYLWVGTFKGLARFDGVRFTVYDARRERALADDHITGLLADSQGRLWVACESGVLLKREQGRFSKISGTPLLPAAAKVATRSTHSRLLRSTGLAEDENGGVWVFDGRPTLLRVVDGATPQVFGVSNGVPSGGMLGLVDGAARQPWLLAGSGLHRLQGGRWIEQARLGTAASVQPAICRAQNGSVWVAAAPGSWSTGGGRVFRVAAGQVEDEFEPTPYATNSPRSQVTAIMEDSQRHIWLGTHWSGVVRSDEHRGWSRPQLEGPLAQCRVTCLLEDRQGAVWVGSLGDGLHRVRQRPIGSLRLPEPAREHLVNTVCVARDGSVWAGTDGAGVFRFQDGAFTHFGKAQGLTAELIFSIFEDRATNLWCGTEAGLFKMRRDRFERPEETPALPGSVIAMFEERSGSLWVGTPRGPARRQDGRFVVRSLGISGTVEIRSMAQDRAGNLWVGTIAQGLFCLRSNVVDRFGPAEGLSNPDARAVWCDADGGVWVGTLGSGLFRLKNGRFQAITVEDGLPDDTINGIIEDGDGNLWCSSYNGIFGCSRRLLEEYERGTKAPLVCRWLSIAEGLDYRACSGAGQPVMSRDAQGAIWCVNQRSLARFDPEVALGPEEPNVLVETVVADGAEIAREGADEVRVPSSVRRFEFRYTALKLARPEEARFRHRLEGLDADWIEAGSDRVAQYSRLEPRDYQFEVSAAGGDGIWRKASAPLKLRVLPRLWERNPVRGLASFLVVGVASGIAFLVSRARLKRRLLLLEMKESTDRERRRIARDLHDDLGGSLTEIGLLAAAAEAGGQGPSVEPGPATQVRTKADALVRTLDEIVWAVNPRHDSAASLAEYLSGYAQEFLRTAGILTRVNVEGPLAEIELTPEQRHGLFLAAKEALNNVVRHAKATKVRLNVQGLDGRLLIRIEDDGCGFDPAHVVSQGDGLRNLRERLSNLGGQAEIRSEPGHGTVVELVLPQE